MFKNKIIIEDLNYLVYWGLLYDSLIKKKYFKFMFKVSNYISFPVVICLCKGYL